MKVVRQIVYESESQEQLDRQLGRSLPDGIRPPLTEVRSDRSDVLTITVRTLYDERVKIDEFPDETLKAMGVTKAVYPPCECPVCTGNRTRRALQAAKEDHISSEPDYQPTRQDESESHEGVL